MFGIHLREEWVHQTYHADVEIIAGNAQIIVSDLVFIDKPESNVPSPTSHKSPLSKNQSMIFDLLSPKYPWMSGKWEVIQNFEFRGLSLSTTSLVKVVNEERCETQLEHMLANDKIV